MGERRKFFANLDPHAVELAIHHAEQATSGEICVVISRRSIADPMALAKREFIRLRMGRTRERNAVLIVVAPASRNFAVIGDSGVHEKCGQSFWDDLAAAMTGHFQRGEFTAGLTSGVRRAGELLARHFPHRSDDRNELSDRIAIV